MGYDRVIGTATVYAIAKCPVKGCKSRRRIVCPDMRIVESFRLRRTYTELLIPAPAGMSARDGFVSPYVQWGETPKSDAGQPFVFYARRLDAMTAAGLVCTEHDRYLKPIPVKGTLNVDKSCDGRCMSATGPSCDCSCGGENHGASWSL